jgi:hypothetical protein
MRIFNVILAMIFLSASGAAYADWQYTKWGMTPGQVAAASKGAVSVRKGDPSEEYKGAEIGATGTYTSGRYKFKANFHFANGKLVDVRLKLIEGEQYALKNDLMGLYGKPFYEGASLGLTTWHDAAKNNRIDLLMIGDEYTSLEYRPLKNESSSGL